MLAAAIVSRVVAVSTLAASVLLAQDPPHRAHSGGALGSVHLATSCRPPAAERLDRAVAWLHSFEFGAAIAGFDSALAADSACAMAEWGIALARWGNPMAAGDRPPALLARGRQASEAAARLSSTATERERAYVAAVSKLYEAYEHSDQAARIAAYERAMSALVAAQPADTEARIFHAIALVATAPPSDKSYALLRRAGATLESLWVAQPDHPGLAHYIIHAYDVPALAPLAAAAARRYAGIAPASAHALHMPAHTFTRVGMWEESVETNRRSVEAAVRDTSIAEALHASDYMEYADLQMRRHAAAKAVRDGLPALVARFDPNVTRGAAPPSAGFYAIAAIPARYALERNAWAEAAALRPRPSAFAFADAVTYFARALGAARLGRTSAAREGVDSLGVLRDRLLASGESYWAEQVEIQRLGAEAWLELASRHGDRALALMREAAEREDATEKNVITPGPLAPARELLGDMLMHLDRSGEALAEYRRTLMKEPRRYRALDGARRAAAAIGDREAAAGYAREIERLRERRR